MLWRSFLLLFIVVIVVVSAYLIGSSLTYRTGFPLDDAWIHQTYARNLGARGEWAFLPGQPSAGSTSPLWTGLLALSYALRLPYQAWTYLLGGASLLAVACLGEKLFRDLVPGVASRIPWAGVFLAGEWHLAWASVSGMETLVNAAAVLLVLWLSVRARGQGWLWIGVCIGLSVWLRPDGITLIGPAAMVLALSEQSWKKKASAMVCLTAGIAFFFGPYLLFNLLMQGSFWPNTFYAKQSEYASLQNVPLLVRLWNELRLPLIGAGLFLLPGFVRILDHSVKKRNWTVLAASIWFVGYALLYALRLPVTYQYGRYLMPAMPVYFTLGLAGSFLLIDELRRNRAHWLLARVGILSTAFVWLAFAVLGAQRYGRDVAIVETEMVETAQWIETNTPAGSLVAAHDIGAVGYFGQRELVDLAGLVSPQVIPFIRDETRLADWLDEQQVDYLVVFEGWYQSLPGGRDVIYRSSGAFSPSDGGSSMVVYRWQE